MPEGVQAPDLVDNDHGHEDQSHAEHDGKRHRRGGRIGDGDGPGRVEARRQERREDAHHAEQRRAADEDRRSRPGGQGPALEPVEIGQKQADHGHEQDDEQGRMGQIVGEQLRGPEGKDQEEHDDRGHDGPDFAGQGHGPGLHVAGGLVRQPQGAVMHEQQHEENAAGQAVRVQQRKQITVEDAVLIQGQALEDVGEGDTEQQRRQEAAQEVAGIPNLAPARAFHLGAELEGHAPDDQGEQEQHKRGVKPGKHDGVGPREGGEGHAAGRDEPHFVAVPKRAHGVVHDAFFRIAFGEKRHDGADTEVETVQEEIHRPEHSPENEPNCTEIHGLSPLSPPAGRAGFRHARIRVRKHRAYAGSLRAYLASR